MGEKPDNIPANAGTKDFLESGESSREHFPRDGHAPKQLAVGNQQSAMGNQQLAIDNDQHPASGNQQPAPSNEQLASSIQHCRLTATCHGLKNWPMN